MNTIGYAIIVDLGKMKVFSINQSAQKNISLQNCQTEVNFESYAKTSEFYSDKAGDFSNSVNGNTSSYENKSDIEIKNRSIEHIGEFINRFAREHKEKLYLAASAPIHSKVESKLLHETKQKICKFLSKDMTNQRTDTIISAFGL